MNKVTTRHTPGPWVLEGSDSWIQSVTSDEIAPYLVAEVYAGDDDGKGNVPLIVAAPELLESLQDCLALLVNGPDGCDDCPVRIEAAARKAIAKATGGDA